jgi:quinoprotein relay system zinc metallohydrolase 2
MASREHRLRPTRRHLLAAMATLAAVPSASRAAGPEISFREVAPGAFAFQGRHEAPAAGNLGAISNVGLIVGRDAALMIDSGGSGAEASLLLEAMGAVTDRPLRHVINTHMHPDHMFGNSVLKAAGAEIVGHHNLPRALEARGAHYLQSYRDQLGADLMADVAIVPPDRTVADTLLLDLGDRPVELRAWKAAHTDNDLTALDSASGTLFSGDLVFLGHLPIVDGSLLGWMRQMDALAALPAQRLVPGHGPPGSPWPAALADERRYFDVLAGDVREAIRAGTGMSQAVETAAASERDRWELFDLYNGRNATAAYAELEWE